MLKVRKNRRANKTGGVAAEGGLTVPYGVCPYWDTSTTARLEELATKLPIPPTATPSGVLKKSAKPPTLDSWFSLREKLTNTSSSISNLAPATFSDTSESVTRCRKIRVYPKDQRGKLLRFFGAARFYFNRTVEYLREPGTVANRYAIQKELLADPPEWAADVPYKIRQMAIEDACQAVKNAKKKYLKTGVFNKVGFRSKKDRTDSFYVPKASVKSEGIFPRSFEDWYITEEVGAVETDCKMIHVRGKFWLCVPYSKKIQKPDTQRLSTISLDPGVRTFLAGYHNGGFIHFGENDFQYIFRELLKADKLLSQRRRECRKAVDRVRFRVSNLVNEMHCRIASWLCKTFDTIVVPPFVASENMLSKLRSKTCRSLLTWAHGRFLKRLQEKAVEYSSSVVIQNEAYTSKTCSGCGLITEIGSRKKWTCCGCGVKWDRDENAARGILLRALVDQPRSFLAESPAMAT